MPKKKETGKLVCILVLAVLLIASAAAMVTLLWSSSDVGAKTSGDSNAGISGQEQPNQDVNSEEELVWEQPDFSISRSKEVKNSSAGTESADKKASGQDFIFADSDSSYLTKKDLKGLSKEELSYARNEIYARHGRIFKTEALQDYFADKTWYEPLYTEDEFPEEELNDYERENAKLIRKYEKEKGY